MAEGRRDGRALRTREELERRSRMMLNWARASCGMDGPLAGFHERDLCRLGRRRRFLWADRAQRMIPFGTRLSLFT
jgi:hypothetical protein